MNYMLQLEFMKPPSPGVITQHMNSPLQTIKLRVFALTLVIWSAGAYLLSGRQLFGTTLLWNTKANDLGDTRARHGLLTPQTEVELATQFQKGKRLINVRNKLSNANRGKSVSDEEVAAAAGVSASDARSTLVDSVNGRAALVAGNMRLVFHIAKVYANRGVQFGDLVEEGAIGLEKAAERFDPSKGYRFSTYAAWWVRQSMSRAVADTSRLVRLPVHIHDQMVSLGSAERSFHSDNQRAGTAKELSRTIGLPAEKVEALRHYTREYKSTDETTHNPAGHKGGRESLFGDQLVSAASDGRSSLLAPDKQKIFEMASHALTDRETRVLQLRFGLLDGNPMTLAQVGEHLCITRERVRQIEATAIQKLKAAKASSATNQETKVKRIRSSVEENNPISGTTPKEVHVSNSESRPKFPSKALRPPKLNSF